MEEVIKVSQKGQFTIPTRLRDKYALQNIIRLIESKEGLLIKQARE
jgi:bifunctional DNA-binding transcriptional regulator/antitoxin component of YhaV-PrlF toxin-antitoxin module